MTWLAIPLTTAAPVSSRRSSAVCCSRSSPARERRRADAGALGGGVVVGVALFDVLPEAFDNLATRSTSAGWRAWASSSSWWRRVHCVLRQRDDDAHVHAHSRVGAFGAAALSAHSFVDGLGIGFAFHVSNAHRASSSSWPSSATTWPTASTPSASSCASRTTGAGGDALADGREAVSARAAVRRDRAARPDRHRRHRRWASCSPSTRGSSWRWARPICYRRPTRIPVVEAHRPDRRGCRGNVG